MKFISLVLLAFSIQTASAARVQIKEGSKDGLIIQRAIDFLSESNADIAFINKAYSWLSRGKFYKDKLDHNAETNLSNYDITFSLPKVTPHKSYIFLRHPYSKKTAVPHHPFELFRQHEFRFLAELAATLYHELIHTGHTSDMGEAIIENEAWTTTIEAMQEWAAVYKNKYENTLNGGNCKKLDWGVRYKSMLEITANYIQDYIVKEYSAPYRLTYKKLSAHLSAEAIKVGKALEEKYVQKQYFNRQNLKKGLIQYCIGAGLAKSGITVVTFDRSYSLQGTTEHELSEYPIATKYKYEDHMREGRFFQYDKLSKEAIKKLLGLKQFFKMIFPYAPPAEGAFEVVLEYPNVKKNTDGSFSVIELGRKATLKIDTAPAEEE